MLPYYQVGSKVFVNKFQALYESALLKLPIRFNLYESAFDLVSWDEPKLSWNELLDIRAHQIAAKKKPIVLNFSGGTDSYTIYQVFKRNNINIDIIRLFVKNDNIKEYTIPNVEKFLKDNYSPTTKVVIVNNYINELRDMYSSPDWAWNNSQRVQFGFNMMDVSYVFKQDAGLHDLDDYCSVTGYEKPRLFFDNGSVYSYQEDNQYGNTMQSTLLESFFISPELPELHVKQSYMLARFVQGLANEEKLPLENYNNIHACFGRAYLDYAIKGCGRFGDLANSSVQKEAQRSSSLIISNNIDQVIYRGRVDVALIEGLKTNESYAVNYIKGLDNLQKDSVLKQFYRHDRDAVSVIDIRSKMYKLNC